MINWELTETEDMGYVKHRTWIAKADLTAKGDNSSIRGFSGGDVNITELKVIVSEYEDGYITGCLEAKHDRSADIYTDKSIVKSLNKQIVPQVAWSERGLQEDGIAHFDLVEVPAGL